MIYTEKRVGKLLQGVLSRGSQVESMASHRKMLIEIIVDLSVVTVFPSFSAVGSWEEVLLFSMDFTVPQKDWSCPSLM